MASDFELIEVGLLLSTRPGFIPANWSRQFHDNVRRIKGGETLQVAAVVRDLTIRTFQEQEPLTQGEQWMLDKASQLLAEDLVANFDLSTTEADRFVADALAQL